MIAKKNIGERLSETTVQQLLKLIRHGIDKDDKQSDDELSAILRYQLAYPVLLGLKQAGQSVDDDIARSWENKTFLQLLTSKSPDIELLREVRSYAKTCRRGKTGALASPVATVLYYAAIASAIVYCDSKITSLSDRDIEKGLEWAVSRSWVGSEIKEILRSAIFRLTKRKADNQNAI